MHCIILVHGQVVEHRQTCVDVYSDSVQTGGDVWLVFHRLVETQPMPGISLTLMLTEIPWRTDIKLSDTEIHIRPRWMRRRRGNLSAPSQDIPANVSKSYDNKPKTLCMHKSLVLYSTHHVHCSIIQYPPDGREQSHAKKYESVREGSVIGWMHAIWIKAPK